MADGDLEWRFEDLTFRHIEQPLVEAGYRREGLTFLADTSQLLRKVVVVRQDVDDAIKFLLGTRVLAKGTEMFNLGNGPLEFWPEHVDPQGLPIQHWWIVSQSDFSCLAFPGHESQPAHPSDITDMITGTIVPYLGQFETRFDALALVDSRPMRTQLEEGFEALNRWEDAGEPGHFVLPRRQQRRRGALSP